MENQNKRLKNAIGMLRPDGCWQLSQLLRQKSEEKQLAENLRNNVRQDGTSNNALQRNSSKGHVEGQPTPQTKRSVLGNERAEAAYVL